MFSKCLSAAIVCYSQTIILATNGVSVEMSMFLFMRNYLLFSSKFGFLKYTQIFYAN